MGNDNKNICYGLCAGDSGVETSIPCNTAKEKYGICIKHGQMETNNELRFRLNCSDGSAYIRTQTSDKSDGWQNVHYHKQVRETYIVEQGWIGYIEIKDGKIRSKKYKAGDLFTTIPGIAHNIYMPVKAIIHTVKHGAGELLGEGQSDWFDDTEDCERLNYAIRTLFPKELEFETFIEYATMESKNPYNEEYRHFDVLIWQVPAWATAIFAAIVAIAGSFLGQKPDEFILKDRISQIDFTAAMFLFFGIFMFILSYALYRFRWHQTEIKKSTWPRAKHNVVSPQLLLQIVVMLEAGILVIGSAFLIEFYVFEVALAIVLSILAIVFLCERYLKILTKNESSEIDQDDYSYLKQRAS